jgi:excisionase family DNA binding protein
MVGNTFSDLPANGNVTAVPERLAYSVPEVAQLLGTTERYVWTLVETERIKSFKIGRLRKVSAEALRNFVRAAEQATR